MWSTLAVLNGTLNPVQSFCWQHTASCNRRSQKGRSSTVGATVFMLSSNSLALVNMFIALLSSGRAGNATECRQRPRTGCYCTYRTGQQQGLRLCDTFISNGVITVAVDRK